MHRNEALLEKYGVKANDAILAEEHHMGLYEDLIQNHDAKLIAGGAAQNTARGAQVRRPNVIKRQQRSLALSLTLLSVVVHPPRKLRRVHWLCWQRQVRRYPR